jgi:hypothetical protein
MKPKPRSATTFLIVPAVTLTSLVFSNGNTVARSPEKTVDHTALATLRGDLHHTHVAEKVRFQTVIEQARGPGATVALIPMDHVAALGGMKQKRVFGWINGQEFMTATFPYRGEGLWVGVPKAAREAAGVVLGDKVTLELMLDEAPRTMAIPRELATAFAAEPELAMRFEKLSFSRKRELADPISEAKKQETRDARTNKALTRLRQLG